jgi:hypothetical protein
MDSQIPAAFIRHEGALALADVQSKSALRAGRFRATFHDSPMGAAHLLAIFKRRANHLRKYSSPHAVQLRVAMSQFCDSLRTLAPDSVVLGSQIEFDEGRSILLAERADTLELIGCLVTVSQSAVLDEEWEALWR